MRFATDSELRARTARHAVSSPGPLSVAHMLKKSILNNKRHYISSSLSVCKLGISDGRGGEPQQRLLCYDATLYSLAFCCLHRCRRTVVPGYSRASRSYPRRKKEKPRERLRARDVSRVMKAQSKEKRSTESPRVYRARIDRTCVISSDYCDASHDWQLSALQLSLGGYTAAVCPCHCLASMSHVPFPSSSFLLFFLFSFSFRPPRPPFLPPSLFSLWTTDTSGHL